MRQLIRMFRYLKRYRLLVFSSLVCMLISTGLNLVQPKLVEWAVDSGISAGSARLVLLGSAGILVSALIGSAMHFSSGMLLVRAGQGMGFDIRNDLFRHVMSLSFANFDRWRTGEILVRINSDVNTIRMFVRMGLLMIIQSTIMLVGSLIVMIATNARLSIIMVIILPLTFALFFLSASLIRPMFLRVRERLDAMNNAVQENLAGAKVVRAFATRDYECDRFDERNRGYMRLSLRVGYIVSAVFPFLFFLGQLSIVLISWFGGLAVIEEFLSPSRYGLTLGQLLAFQNYALMAMWPIMALGMVLNFISRASASADRIEQLLAETPDIAERRGAIERERFSGKIEFKSVSFAFGGGENAVDSVNLSIEPGEKIGVLGRTGAGKSSLAALIPRFYDPTSGSVLLDGFDLRELSLRPLRKRIALVLQETILITGTIRENIAFARPDASDEEIEAAASIACALEFIESHPDRWDLHVGERGTGLSGGQRQRTAIARAILSAPDILILDDVTSSVDARTERQIVGNLYASLTDTTVIIISQKINTMLLADRIVLMESGRVVDTGTHAELLERSTMYREVYETQSAEIRS